ncbi:MAG: ring-cleaving dioxygenase [Thermoanaerobaculia bacterium]
MTAPIAGIHHVTAIATDPRRTLDFYTRVLGLRLVKRTVNFDDPGTYHLYFGDDLGRPGTVLTFFPWPLARRGIRGVGQATATAFSVPAGSLGFWQERLRGEGVAVEEPAERFGGEEGFAFQDPDGLKLELVAHEGADERPGWGRGPLPAEHAIRGFHSVTLSEQGYQATAELLTQVLGFRLVAEEGSRSRFEAGDGGPGARVDVHCAPSAPFGRVAAGSVHHVAWRVADEEAQAAWRERLAARGLNVTPVLDRQYFRSIYFREPGGVLFEIATDRPGFTLDESPDALGEALKLPPWLEPRRAEIEDALPELRPEPVT